MAESRCWSCARSRDALSLESAVINATASDTAFSFISAENQSIFLILVPDGGMRIIETLASEKPIGDITFRQGVAMGWMPESLKAN